MIDGNLTTQGTLKTFTDINVNDQIQIETNEIRSLGSNDLKLVPAPGRIANFATNSALQIPVGDTNARPPSNQLADGQIRFNTDTQQYEGYNALNTAWSSLGGVRDLDGNTFIKAEETVGANDNTLWFINDGINTIKITNEFLEFVNCKKISSSNVNAPSYDEWNANTPVNLGDYLKYKNNLYEVTVAGTTATFLPLVLNQHILLVLLSTELLNLHSGVLLLLLSDLKNFSMLKLTQLVLLLCSSMEI